MNATDFLDELRDRLKTDFKETRRVMSFEDYLDLFTAAPRQQARSAAQYVLDCFRYFGATDVESFVDASRRWQLFDVGFDEGRDKLIGQERAQEAIYRIVTNFARQRRVNKLVMLHGPNGSAKSSIIACIGRALEAYSRADDGALYTFNWVFPSRNVAKQRLGFGSGGAGLDDGKSYAFLAEEEIDALIPGDLRDHPLLLLPRTEREELLALTAGKHEGDNDYLIPDNLRFGELAPRNRQIAELLFRSYEGDMTRVLRHVQVERFFFSRRYRRGAVTVEPQLQVDAAVRQLTGDRSLTSLPRVLQSTTLYEPFGDLIDAHRGFIEYNDLLKRPIDTFKYLLSTCEKSQVALSNQILHLDLLFIASSNETHLKAFKEYPDWASFKARIELVRVPYLRCYKTEQRIYDEQITEAAVRKRIAPHATHVAALWAVLTRLKKPQPDRYPKLLRGTIAALTPLQKAELYANGRTPKGLALDKARLLKGNVEEMAEESVGEANYEGRMGASPREMKLVLLNAAQRTDYPTVSPLAVLTEIRELCRHKSVYDFLRMDPEGQYHDHVAFIDVVKERWITVADEELTKAMGLVSRSRYDDLFKRYLVQVIHMGRGEKVYNTVTGSFDEPDKKFVEEMETHFKVDKNAEDFRSEVLGRIGAASQRGAMDGESYRLLFPDLFDNLEASYFHAQRDTIRKIATDILRLLSDDIGDLEGSARRRAQKTLDELKSSFGYCDASAQETISTLLSERYRD